VLHYSYYPFKNDLEKIDGNDLALLNDISEGWYIDYKSQGLKIVDYAKHISAFANQYGGWLIIGVREKTDNSRTAGEFIGIDDVDKILTDLREAASSHVSPEILYEEKVVKGNIDEISLKEGKSIIIVGIPRSLNTPHIHSSGRIYRRLADQSKPKEETDRFILDDLWERGQDHNKSIIEFLTDIPSLPNKASKNKILHIFFKPNTAQASPQNILQFDEFAEIVTNQKNSVNGTHAPLTAISTAPHGYIARQIEKNDPSSICLTIRWWHNGSVRFDIPLNSYDFTSFEDISGNYKYALEYLQQARKDGYTDIDIVDYSNMIQVVSALSNSYIHMLKKVNDKRDLFSCFTLRNIFHTSPFVDTKKFINKVSKYSLPITLEDKISIPKKPTENNMYRHFFNERIGFHGSESEQHSYCYSFSAVVFLNILISVGLVNNYDDFVEDIEIYGFN